MTAAMPPIKLITARILGKTIDISVVPARTPAVIYKFLVYIYVYIYIYMYNIRQEYDGLEIGVSEDQIELYIILRSPT